MYARAARRRGIRDGRTGTVTVIQRSGSGLNVNVLIATRTRYALRAVADGVVEAAGWQGASGISITLRHARGYKTMYNHLSRLDVGPGQRVRQRQVIGRVGSTGLSTGPHLDYRVVKHSRLVNPLGERFVPGSPVPPERQAAFRKHLRVLLSRLDREAPLPDAAPRAVRPRPPL